MSPKQAIYRWLIHHGFVDLRMRESNAAGASLWWIIRHRRYWRNGAALANLLHRLHETVLEPGFGETDFGFLNHAAPRYLHEVGDDVNRWVLAGLIQLHDVVPDEVRSELTWHPSESHRRGADKTTGLTSWLDPHSEPNSN